MNNYIEQYKILHKKSPDYGATSVRYVDEMALVINLLKPRTVLDFGCGKGSLIGSLQEKYPDIKIYGYDPAIEERSILPVDNADLVVCTDVLEHIPEKNLPSVVKTISSISKKCFFVLHHDKAGTTLPNGENAHCTIHPLMWYVDLFSNYFDTTTALSGRMPWLSVVVTFDIPDKIKKKYYLIQAKTFRGHLKNIPK